MTANARDPQGAAAQGGAPPSGTCLRCGGPIDHLNNAFTPDVERVVRALEAAELLWGVVANVSGGDWTLQSAEWQGAAARAREAYHAVLRTALP